MRHDTGPVDQRAPAGFLGEIDAAPELVFNRPVALACVLRDFGDAGCELFHRGPPLSK